MDLPQLFLHGLGWLWPGFGLTALTLVWWLVRRPTAAPRMGWWGATLIMLAAALTTQGIALWWWRWPDGSMATYGTLILVLAVLRVFLTRPDPRLS